ncbi:unnamed protein product [Hermetia illucens]|uniref:snRNA-activating protein complex subunit 1 n=1 Tax=Hermetia illucens TaxID=343691 RepID=A0A7R8UX29_HERIL|nr:unnamed protein product [Hermetia illucens]
MDKVKHAIALDCERLVETFANNETHEFEVFCKIWKKQFFQHMYSALLWNVEIIQMTEHIFKAVSRIMFENESLRKRKERKIGALYLIYAVYFKQPTEQFVKFKVTLEKWKILKEFVESLRNDPTTIQVRYIFHKLITVNAFRLVAMENDYGFEDLFNNAKVKNRKKHRLIWNTVQTDVSELGHPRNGLIESLSILEGGYNEMKTILNSQAQQSGDSSFAPLPMSQFMDEVKSSFKSISDLLKPNMGEERDSNASKPNVKKEKIEDIRRSLKRKAFRTDGNDEDAQYEVSLHGDMIQIARNDRRLRVNNQKISQIFEQDLPEDTRKELYAEDEQSLNGE